MEEFLSDLWVLDRSLLFTICLVIILYGVLRLCITAALAYDTGLG